MVHPASSPVAAAPSPVHTPTSTFSADLWRGEVLHLWLRARAAESGSPQVVLRQGTCETPLTGRPGHDFQRVEHQIDDSGLATVTWDADTIEVSLGYAFDPGQALDQGMRILWTTPANAGDTIRYRLHLAPPFGWMNDPNGMVSLNGRVHAFYQHYPHARYWNTMHWGHAVSDNLVDWRHLPVFLNPRPEMLATPGKAGGAYSGTVIPTAAGGLRVFHTDREDHRTPEQEWQMTALSEDLLTTGPSQVIFDTRPDLPGFGRDLRDPFVFRGPCGHWQMVLGGQDARGGVVLLYETSDPEAVRDWTFASVLHREALPRPFPAECPCLLPLTDELWVLIFGLVGQQRLVLGRLNPTLALIGRFDGQRFQEISRQYLDMIGDCYAFQGFLHEGQPLGMAWAANWADVRPRTLFSGAMTLPRRLIWRNGQFLTPPVEAVADLRLERIGGAAELSQGLDLPGGLADIVLDFPPGSAFRLMLDHPDYPVALVHDGATFWVDTPWAVHRGQPLLHAAETGPIGNLRVIVDVGLIEFFAQDGRWCGSRRIDSDAPVTCARLDLGHNAAAEVWSLRPQTGAVAAPLHTLNPKGAPAWPSSN